jgi:hypothetical protein
VNGLKMGQPLPMISNPKRVFRETANADSNTLSAPRRPAVLTNDFPHVTWRNAHLKDCSGVRGQRCDICFVRPIYQHSYYSEQKPFNVCIICSYANLISQKETVFLSQICIADIPLGVQLALNDIPQGDDEGPCLRRVPLDNNISLMFGS